jgi:hypothetical protein
LLGEFPNVSWLDINPVFLLSVALWGNAKSGIAYTSVRLLRMDAGHDITVVLPTDHITQISPSGGRPWAAELPVQHDHSGIDGQHRSRAAVVVR